MFDQREMAASECLGFKSSLLLLANTVELLEKMVNDPQKKVKLH